MMEKNEVAAEDPAISQNREVQSAPNDPDDFPDSEATQTEINFDIDFEDDLGPSLEEVLLAATQEVITTQDSEDDTEETDPSTGTVDTGDIDRHWYVVHCYSGYENKVCHNLEQRIESMDMRDKIFDVVVPTEEEIAVKDGKRKTVERQVFPGYILVQMELSEESWYVVRNTPGVTGFVGATSRPSPLTLDDVVKFLLPPAAAKKPGKAAASTAAAATETGGIERPAIEVDFEVGSPRWRTKLVRFLKPTRTSATSRR